MVDEILKKHGFEHFGWAPLKTPLSLSVYKNWINEGLHGEMNYLKTQLPQKENPNLLLPAAKSAISVLVPYLPQPYPQKILSDSLKVALYAKGTDYHRWMHQKLGSVVESLKEIFPDDEFACFSDSGAVLERDLAYQAGLGWIGKNTCLLNERAGSLFFIGEIFTSLETKVVLEPMSDRCGSCTKCIDSCPTGAIVEPQKLDARLCISYQTIESNVLPDEKLRNHTWYYGCDICQTVCPWNQKVYKTTLQENENQKPVRENLVEDLRRIMNSSNRQILKIFEGTAMNRATPFRHRKNAVVVAAQSKLVELKKDIETLSLNPRYRDVTTWALKTLADQNPI